MKRYIALCLLLAVVLTVPAGAFSDVPKEYAFHDAIEYCVGKGILSGYGDGTFRPTEDVTRAQFCVMLVRAFYPGEAEKYDSWRSKGWYAPSAAVLNAHNAMHYGEQHWTQPSVMNGSISRSDMARFLANIMADKGYTVSEEAKRAAQASIRDFDQIPANNQDAVRTVYALGIITGFPGGTFESSAVMKRGQAAVVIYRTTQCLSAAPGELKPSQAAPAAPTGGKAPTEETAVEILKELQAKYPEDANFALGYADGDSSLARVALHTYYSNLALKMRTSCTLGCGGWSCLVSDAIFGQSDFPARKTTLENARVGDLVVQYSRETGELVHVAVITGRPEKVDDKIVFTVTEAAQGDIEDYHLYWDEGYTYFPQWKDRLYDYDVWTRYPD